MEHPHKPIIQQLLWECEPCPLNVAVLIDGENVSYKHIDAILTEALALGIPIVSRVYGNWASSLLNGWRRLLTPYQLEARHHHLAVPGKNATDIALVVDATELLYRQQVQAFCLAASDSDYTPLVRHLRDAGCIVFGFGKETTPSVLQEACHTFVSLEPVATAESSRPELQRVLSPLQPMEMQGTLPLETMVLTAYTQLSKEHPSWVLIPNLETRLVLLYPAFTPQQYGHRSVYRLVKARFPLVFELRSCPSKQHIQELRRKRAA